MQSSKLTGGSYNVVYGETVTSSRVQHAEPRQKAPTLWRKSMSLVTVPGLGEVSESTPFCSEAENHTMPHRETVARVAYCRLSTC